MNRSLLVVDDEQAMCELLEADLTMRGFEVTWFTSPEQALEELKQTTFDSILTDLKMPRMDGIQFCRHAVEARPDIPVIVMTAFGSMETAIEAIRAGAYDFIVKPFDTDVLKLTLERALKHRALQKQLEVLSEAVQRTQQFDELIGASPVMQTLYDQVKRVADSEASILITGESGSGKELVARSIHRRSRRIQKPFVAINCAALPEALLESELFGHVKGAFTDARADRKGLFEQAEGGTLFLDEIGELPIAMQPKLLRAIEEGKVRPVGANNEIEFDARIITATNRDLESAVEDGQFREDLFFRVNVIQLEVPPLRARGTDVLLLSQYFLDLFAKRSGKGVTEFSEQVAERLISYHWPGNVRELRNVMERAVALTRYDQIVPEDLPQSILEHKATQVVLAGDNPSELVPLQEIERRYIEHVLTACDGNKTKAAKVLGLDRKTLYRKLKEEKDE
ncbi:MAG: DNA-binding NtrC family response regulator [Pirellulaceae bacterium]|jgi:DNA-binding NtrC family response regulator